MSKNNTKLRQHTTANSYSTTGRKTCTLEDIAELPNTSAATNTVVVVENISLTWARRIADSWSMEWSFFEGHSMNPRGVSTTWDAIFGPTPWQRPRQDQNKSSSVEPKPPNCAWHVDGIFEFGQPSSSITAQLIDPNWMPRRLEYGSKHGWQANTRISCYAKQCASSRICWSFHEARCRARSS